MNTNTGLRKHVLTLLASASLFSCRAGETPLTRPLTIAARAEGIPRLIFSEPTEGHAGSAAHCMYFLDADANQAQRLTAFPLTAEQREHGFWIKLKEHQLFALTTERDEMLPGLKLSKRQRYVQQKQALGILEAHHSLDAPAAFIDADMMVLIFDVLQTIGSKPAAPGAKPCPLEPETSAQAEPPLRLQAAPGEALSISYRQEPEAALPLAQRIHAINPDEPTLYLNSVFAPWTLIGNVEQSIKSIAVASGLRAENLHTEVTWAFEGRTVHFSVAGSALHLETFKLNLRLLFDTFLE